MNARKLRLESLEERNLLAVIAGGVEQAVMLPAPTESQTWVVNTLEDPTEWDTTDEVLSLREAIDSASKGDTIIFDESLSGGTITLSGSQLDVFRRITIDASSVGGITIDADGKSRVFEITGGDDIKPVELISLTITGGYTFYDVGGGICCHDGILTMTSCTVSRNVSILEGGGICNFDGTLTLTDSIVSGNRAVGGAGILNASGTLTLIGSTVSGNTAYSSDGGYGGGIYNEFGTVTMMDCTVSENTAFSGAGIYNNYSTLTLTNSTVSGNTANGYGGGIYCSSYSTLILANSTVSGNIANLLGGGICSNNYSTVTLTDSTVSENTSSSGGGIYNIDGTLTFANSTVSGNIANSLGGGICNNNYSTVTLTDSTVSENTSSSGGGIYNDSTLTLTNTAVSGNTATEGGGTYNSGTLTMTNCIISGNAASGTDSSCGGGVYDEGMLTLTNCTVSGNTASFGGGIYDEGHSYICDTIFANTIITLNTADIYGDDIYIASATIYAYNTLSSNTFWSLSSNCLLYDPTKPLFNDAANGDYILVRNSQAIDIGDNSLITAETDLAGDPRIVNGNVDIGAYEYQETDPRQLEVPVITTGNRAIYVSYGANRHQIQWNAVENASGYELSYSCNGDHWTTVSAAETAAIVTGLTYGQYVQYRVRALGADSYTDSNWSALKTFNVCPMDVNNDGDIGGLDRNILAISWGGEEGEDEYRYYADINADGDIGGLDRNFLGLNWGAEAVDYNLTYPQPLAADTVFAAYDSGEIES